MTLKGATEGFLRLGLFKFTLLASLPVVILVSLSANQKLQTEQIINTVHEIIKEQQNKVCHNSLKFAFHCLLAHG